MLRLAAATCARKLPHTYSRNTNPLHSGIACTSARRRLFASSSDRPVETADVVIVGAGPAGLSAAIKLRQHAQKSGRDLKVIVVEKGAEIGAVIEPIALNELIPNWKEKGAPVHVEAKDDHFVFLTEKYHLRLPTPPQMHNKGNYIVSLSNVVKWLGKEAEEAGVMVFPGTAASEVLYNTSASGAVSVKGIATNDIGIGKNGEKKESYAQGMELHAKLTIFAEGCRGHLTKTLFEKFKLREGVDPQSYGIGIKEVWEVDPSKAKPGTVVHTVGWPLDTQTYGGSFLYHMDKNLVAVGFVIGLDYTNPYLNPYREFQRWKHHPYIRSTFEGGRPIAYGARALSEGGLQCIPKLVFPGGALIGDTAGFLNTPKIKGTHTAMKSGMLAADCAFEVLSKLPENSTAPVLLSQYPEAFKKSWAHEELHRARNIRPSFQRGLFAGIAYSAVDTYVLRGKAPWTFPFKHADHETLIPAAQAKKISYPKPDGKISFDLMTSVSRSGTNHNEDQPAHLRLKDPKVPVEYNLKKFDGPESRYCPAGVYEYVNNEKGEPRLQINFTNCVHCKTCDIKDPKQNINWVNPEGGGGPLYQNT